jgi:hypothetical protein
MKLKINREFLSWYFLSGAAIVIVRPRREET